MRSTLAVTLLALLVGAAPAAAWEVRVQVVGSGTADEVTPANKLFCISPQTTPNWTVGSECLAGTPSGEYGHGWTVRYTATPSPGWRFLRWQSDGTTRAPVVCDDSGGSSTYTGTECQFGTFDNYQTQAVFEDITAPTPSVTSGPAAGSTTGRSVTFAFGATNNPVGQPTTYSCRLTGPSGLVEGWTGCSPSGKTYSSLGDGGHTFDVKASDPSGNNATASRAWTVDAVAPETLLTDGPAASSTVTQRTATFQFTGSGDPAQFRCRIDSGPVVAPCDSPYTTPQLSDGPHTFYVWAIDARGNEEISPAQRTWTIDSTAPETTITGGPAEGSSTTATTATFTLSAGEPATYRCSLDGAAPVACTSSHAISGLTVGTHTLRVWARDTAGNEDPSPATRTWTVTAPIVEQQPGGDPGSATGTVTPTPGTLPTTPLIVPTTTVATLPTCRVPKLKGKTLRAAKKALTTARCALGKVTRKRSRRVPGRVIAQKLRAGTTHVAGKKVAVVVSKR